MIELYTWPTPNGHKIHIMLEECGLPYQTHAVDIGAGDQFAPDFLKISPNNKIPAIVDSDGPDGKPMSMFESGAILIYLASKTGRFLPQDVRGKYVALQWLMFQMGGVGPMLGQAHHFRLYAPEKIEYATRQPGRRPCRIPEREALVRRGRRAARRSAWHQGARGSAQTAGGRQGARNTLRLDSVQQALTRYCSGFFSRSLNGTGITSMPSSARPAASSGEASPRIERFGASW